MSQLQGKQVVVRPFLGALTNFMYRPVLGIAISLFALVAVASPAHAQSTEGTFQLSSEVHWGHAILQPGEYHIRIAGTASEFSTVKQITLESSDKTTVLLSMGLAGGAPGTVSCLKIDSLNGVSFVHELDSVDLQAKFFFAAPKVRHESVSLGRPLGKTSVAVLILPVRKSN